MSSPDSEKIRNEVIAALSLERLDDLIHRFVDAELRLSHRRRTVHRMLDVRWAERENRRSRHPDGDL